MCHQMPDATTAVAVVADAAAVDAAAVDAIAGQVKAIDRAGRSRASPLRAARRLQTRLPSPSAHGSVDGSARVKTPRARAGLAASA